MIQISENIENYIRDIIKMNSSYFNNLKKSFKFPFFLFRLKTIQNKNVVELYSITVFVMHFIQIFKGINREN